MTNISASHKADSPHGKAHSVAHENPGRRELAIASLALGALAAVCILAFFAPAEKVALADQVALLFLAAMMGSLLWMPLLRALENQHNAATFFLTAAMFVIYSLARRVAPENGWSLRFAKFPADEYIFSYASYVVVLGAILTSPYWRRRGSAWTRSLCAGIVLIAGIAAWSFWLLARFYPVGAAQRLDPSPLPHLVLMLIEYASVALLCRAVCAHVATRHLAFKGLPLVLLALWARFHFSKPAEDAE
jgi:hypothetical protein